MNKISLLKNPIQEYAWGSKTEIQDLIGESTSTGKPMAELWMGAHPKAPSEALLNGKWRPLDKVIEKNPESILGKHTAKKFSSQLPFLFKILAADKPLSIQVHPNLEQAHKGFEGENDLGIPLNAPNRNYRDNNHKPEILCAITPFQGMTGFREVVELLELIDRLSLASLSGEIELLHKDPSSHGLKSFFSALMMMDKKRQHEVTSEAVRAAEKFADKDNAYRWVVQLNREYPKDIGILSPIILNLVRLEPGEAMYLPAGELHSYLHGLGIELMANSDNVLRGGLTAKHIDVPELLNIVNFEAGPVRKITSTSLNTCRTIYETPAKEFQLSTISVDDENSFISPSDRSVEILICLRGKAGIENIGSGEILPIKLGLSVIIPSEISRYRIAGNAMFYAASVPI
jgi:mannose-6-phosphate isomerase